MGFSRQEYWSVLPCPPPRDLPKVQKARGTQYSWVGMKVGDRVWGSGVLVKLKNRLSFTTGMKGERPGVVLGRFSCVQLFATPWSVAHQALGQPVDGILQARILEWVAISFSRASF